MFQGFGVFFRLYNTQIQRGNSGLNIDQNMKGGDGLFFRHFWQWWEMEMPVGFCDSGLWLAPCQLGRLK